jgi:hypothetical protein
MSHGVKPSWMASVSQHLGKIAVAFAIASLFVGWLALNVQSRRQMAPTGIVTVRDYFERFGDPRFVRFVNHRGDRYYEFGGPMPALWTLPSSGPSYIFDEQGRFVDWHADPGDAPDFYTKWELDETGLIPIESIKEQFGVE